MWVVFESVCDGFSGLLFHFCEMSKVGEIIVFVAVNTGKITVVDDDFVHSGCFTEIECFGKMVTSYCHLDVVAGGSFPHVLDDSAKGVGERSGAVFAGTGIEVTAHVVGTQDRFFNPETESQDFVKKKDRCGYFDHGSEGNSEAGFL